MCYLCEARKELEAHHLKSFIQYPDLRFDINNGITLCKKCHDSITGKEEEFCHDFTTASILQRPFQTIYV